MLPRISEFRGALGFFYEDSKTYIKEEDGKEVRYQEIQRKYQVPDVGACSIILKNKDKDGNGGDSWANDPLKLESDASTAKKESFIRVSLHCTT